MATEIKRQTANLVSLGDILQSAYARSEKEMEPNYILTKHNLKISRVNVMGVVLDKQEEPSSITVTLDDGTGKIAVRAFEKDTFLSTVVVGDILLIIAKPREFNNQKYLVPEIVKKILNPSWLQLRKIQLSAQKNSLIAEDTPTSEPNITPATTDIVEEEIEITEEPLEENTLQEKDNPYNKILSALRILDSGQGADIDAVVEKASVPKAEIIIKRLVEEGEIFEIKPGKLKILE